MFDWIAFDADDTLWQNEEYYHAGRELFRRLLLKYGLDEIPDEIIDEIETNNLPVYGYGAMGFVLSLVESAVQLTAGQLSGTDTQALLDFGKHMLGDPVQVFPHAAETLANLAERYPLVLITKGDLRHQQAKIESSGLAGYFRHTRVVSDKSAATYRLLMDQLGITPDRFLMVGNSLRSDILPAIEAGGWGIFIPNHLTWNHEHSEPPADARQRFWEARHLGEVPALIARLAAGDRNPPSQLQQSQA